MPVISSFFGIYIRMYHADHAPPHIHAEYQGHEALVEISTGHILEGSLPMYGTKPEAGSEIQSDHFLNLRFSKPCGACLFPV